MVRSDLLRMLVCPDDQSPLIPAAADLVDRLNRAIALGRVTNRAGQKVDHRLSGGLLRADRTFLYPIVDDIPMMLVDEAIPMAQPGLET